MNIEKLNQAIDEVLKAFENLKDVVNEEQLNEMAPFITSLPFAQYRQEVLRLYNKKKARQKFQNEHPDDLEQAQELYPKEPHENGCSAFETKNVLITNHCIEHVAKQHNNMDTEKWQEFLDVFEPKTDERTKAKHHNIFSERWVCKCFGKDKCFGYVLDDYETTYDQIVTVFCNSEAEVDNWIMNEVKKHS